MGEDLVSSAVSCVVMTKRHERSHFPFAREAGGGIGHEGYESGFGSFGRLLEDIISVSDGCVDCVHGSGSLDQVQVALDHVCFLD